MGNYLFFFIDFAEVQLRQSRSVIEMDQVY